MAAESRRIRGIAGQLVNAIGEHAQALDIGDTVTARYWTNRVRQLVDSYSGAIADVAAAMDPFDDAEGGEVITGDRLLLNATYHMVVHDKHQLLAYVNDRVSEAGLPAVVEVTEALSVLYGLESWNVDAVPGLQEIESAWAVDYDTE